MRNKEKFPTKKEKLEIKDVISEYIQKKAETLKGVKSDNLIPEVEGIFNSYFVEKDTLKAQGQIDNVKSKIEKIKDPEVKYSNEQFFHSFDQKIIGGVDVEGTQEFIEQDNG